MRLDQAVVERGLVDSRSKAQGLIRDGVVSVSGRVVTKPAHQVSVDDAIELLVESVDVGRGAIKLRYALDHFAIDVSGKTVVDVGASTGGFTQVCLERGAAHVVAIDVGHDQLDATLVSDPRVSNREGVNILEVTPSWWSAERLPEDVSVVVADLSFISLQKVVPHLVTLFPRADLVLLVKPQFEVGKGKTRGGIVKYELDRKEALSRVMEVCRGEGFTQVTAVASPIEGKKGNVEYLLYSSRQETAG
jgi:23S rRNA (cytidine1920-2'-O)/16S rRNA (cytidine1409-2'-O)-methyltransferase